MDNSRKHDSIGTKTHRTAPLETSASEQQPQNTTTSDVATSEAVKTNMAATNPPNFNPNPGGNNGIVQNTVAATTPAAPTTPAAATTTSTTSTPAASSAAINSAPTTTALVLANKPIFLASAPPYFVAAGMPPGGAPGSVSGGPSPYPPGAHAGTSTSNKTFQRPAVFNKLESLVQDMQDKVHGVPVRDQKTFLTSIPFAFMGYDLIEWLMDRLSIEDSLEAVHLANLLCQFGYYFPIGELKNLLVKDDSSLYRFQSPYYWPSQSHMPDNIEYAIYLSKRSQQRKKDKHALEDYEVEAYTNLKKILTSRWDFVTMQSEEQLRQSKDRKRDDKQIIDSQERAYWRVYRPPPGYTTVVESSPVPTREHRIKARSRTKEHISEEVKFLREYTSMSRNKVSQVLESLIDYTDTFMDFDPILSTISPSNPWITDDPAYWLHNQPLVDTPTEKRVRKWEISLEDLVIDPLGVKELMEYMKKEYSHENLRFWLAVQELRYGPGTEAKIRKKVKEIWDEFLSPGAKSEINIDGRTLEATKLAMKTPSRYTFEVAAGHVYMLLLKKDCYPRFIRSENYRTIVANAVNPGKVKSRIFNFPRVPRRPGRSGGTSGGTSGPIAAGGQVKEDYANYGIYGATGQGDLSDSPPDGAEDPAFPAPSRATTNDAICPWELDDNVTPSKPKDDKKVGGGHVRRGSDPTSSNTTSKASTTTVAATKPRLIHPTPPSTAAAIATSVLPLEAASAIVSSTSKVSSTVTTANTKRTASTSSEYPSSSQTVSNNPPTLDPKTDSTTPTHEKHRHSESGTVSSGGQSHHHHHHHHHHHVASKGKSRNRRSKKRISTRAASSAASSSTNVVDNEIDQAMANTETTTSGATSKEVKSHNPPIHQHSAASLLTSVASASFAMASIEGKPPVTVTVTSTTISSSPPSATSGAVASATVALLPSTMGDAASVMETKCTQTKLEDKDLEFMPESNANPGEAVVATVVDKVDDGGGDEEDGEPITLKSNEASSAVMSLGVDGNEAVGGQEANVTSTGEAPVIEAPAGAESKGELGTWTRSTTEVCPWEDEDNRKESHAPFVKTYATLGYL